MRIRAGEEHLDLHTESWGTLMGEINEAFRAHDMKEFYKLVKRATKIRNTSNIVKGILPVVSYVKESLIKSNKN